MFVVISCDTIRACINKMSINIDLTEMNGRSHVESKRREEGRKEEDKGDMKRERAEFD